MEPPIPPNEEDCCNSGCTPCVFDVYEEKLKKFKSNCLVASVFKNCISETSYTVFKLIHKEKHTEDTLFLTFEYLKKHRGEVIHTDNLRLHFKPGQHFLIRANLYDDFNHFTRAYTPLLLNNLPDLQFKVLVKLYEDGAMSCYLHRLKIGEETLWRGPYGDFEVENSFKNVLMIAQGTGIAPLHSIIKKMLNDDNFETFVKLYFCCRSCNDILMRDELYQMLGYWNFSYEVFLTDLKEVDSKYNEIIHRKKLDRETIRNFLMDKGDGLQILICGSVNFNQCILDYLDDFDGANVKVF